MAWRESTTEVESAADAEEDASSVWRASFARWGRGISRVAFVHSLSTTESSVEGAASGGVGGGVQEPLALNSPRLASNGGTPSLSQKSTNGEDGSVNQYRENVGPSYLLPRLEEQERIFMEMVVDGDVTIVHNFLNQHPTFNINCRDFQGLTPLALAVRDGDLAMVDVILSRPGIDVGDCALRAAQTGDPHVLLLLLEKQRMDRPGGEFVGCVGSSDFADGTTPLLVAAQGNHYDSIALLLARGHALRRPHPPFCKCEPCAKDANSDDQLTVGKRRVASYRAWVSPAYLCHFSPDPILDAFLLGSDIQKWLLVTTAFLKDYKDLANKARKFAADLLGCCRTVSEVRLLLRQRAGCVSSASPVFPRLVLAVSLEQKEFVAHPNTQLAIRSAWSGDWGSWRTRSTLLILLTLLARIPLLPWVALVTIVAPYTKMGRHYAAPVNKFLSDIASHIVFLALVFVESNLDKRWQLRGPPSSGVEPLIVLWVVGQIWSSTRMCFIVGPRRYFSFQRNWYDAITQLLFVTTFLFWTASALDVSANGQRALERKYWHWLDPTLLAEGFFVLAAIFAFGRLQQLFQFSAILGPLQVAVQNMIKDIAKFLLLFAFVILAFTWGLNRFYQYYDGMTQKDSSGATTTQARSFVSFYRTIMTLFWCIFCMSPLESADVVIENMPCSGQNPFYNRHYFTQAVGYLCYTAFLVLSVTMLLNMLVATICSTYQRVTNNIEIEWTFGQTQTILVYFSQTTLPPPLNLIPTMGCCANCCKWMFQKCRRRDPEKQPRSPWSFVEDAYPPPPADEDDPREYAVTVATLAQRYFRQHEDSAYSPNALSPATADMENLRREVRLLRSSLLPGLEEAMAAARSSEYTAIGSEETAMTVDDSSMDEESPSQPSTSETANLGDLAARVTHHALPIHKNQTIMSVSGVENNERDISAGSSLPGRVLTHTAPVTGPSIPPLRVPYSGTSIPNRDGFIDSSIRNQDLVSGSSISIRDRPPSSIIPIRGVCTGTSIFNRSVPSNKEVTLPGSSISRANRPPQEESALSHKLVPSTGKLNVTFVERKLSCVELTQNSSESPFRRAQPSQIFPADSGVLNAPLLRSKSRLPVHRRRRTRGSRLRSCHLPFTDIVAPSPSDEESWSDVTVAAAAATPRARPRLSPLRLRSRSRTRLRRHRPQLVTMREEDESMAEVEDSGLVASLIDIVQHDSRHTVSSPESKHDVSTQESMPDVSCDVIFDSDPDANPDTSQSKVYDSHEIDFGSDTSRDATSPAVPGYRRLQRPCIYRMEMAGGENVSQRTGESEPQRQLPRSSDAEEGTLAFDWSKKWP